MRVLRALQADHRPATADEQAILARWSSWGALPAVFDTRDMRAAREFVDIRAELRRLLSEQEWQAAVASTSNAHFTDAAIVSACWDLLARLGFVGGRVLEPGCGSDNFLGMAPERLAAATELVGVEVEPVTAAIAAALYPHAEIRSEGFETTRLPPGSFAAAIGNVPFGDYVLHDSMHNPARHSVHNHFLLKAADLLEPGGVLVALTSTWTLDRRNPAARRDLRARADLLGAVRLPSGAHRASAGTVVTDLVVLRRRREHEAALPFDWELTELVDTADGPARINARLAAGPQAILGVLGLGGVHATTVRVTGAADWLDQLRQQLTDIAERAEALGRTWAPVELLPPAAAPARPQRPEAGSLALPDGIAGALVEITDSGPRPVRARTSREASELRAARHLDSVLTDLRERHGRADADLANARNRHGQRFPNAARRRDLETRRVDLTAELEKLGQVDNSPANPAQAPAREDAALGI